MFCQQIKVYITCFRQTLILSHLWLNYIRLWLLDTSPKWTANVFRLLARLIAPLVTMTHITAAKILSERLSDDIHCDFPGRYFITFIVITFLFFKHIISNFENSVAIVANNRIIHCMYECNPNNSNQDHHMFSWCFSLDAQIKFRHYNTSVCHDILHIPTC